MNTDDMRAIVAQITYKPGWSIALVEKEGDRPYLQVSVGEGAEAAMCAVTRQRPYAWDGGKRWLSPHMCRQEIVGQCFGAFKDAEDHELREWFRYKGAAIYGPHIDPDELIEVSLLTNTREQKVEEC